MLFISAILLAATAAASVQQQNNTPMFSQKELAYMPIKTAQQHCGNDNNLVCCEHDSDDCERITIPGGINDGGLLINQCNTQVFCCDNNASVNGGKIEGNVDNSCVAMGNVSH